MEQSEIKNILQGIIKILSPFFSDAGMAEKDILELISDTLQSRNKEKELEEFVNSVYGKRKHSKLHEVMEIYPQFKTQYVQFLKSGKISKLDDGFLKWHGTNKEFAEYFGNLTGAQRKQWTEIETLFCVGNLAQSYQNSK